MKTQISISRSIGRRSPTSALAIIPLILILALPVAASEVVLLPGVDIREATFVVGSWCRYLVIDEAEGVVDSSELYIAVVGEVSNGDKLSYWVEIESGVSGAVENDRELVKALISNDIKQFQEGDSLYQYIEMMYLRKGVGPVTLGDRRKFQQLSLTAPTSDAGWSHERASVETPVGPIECNHKALTVEDSREMPSDRMTIVKTSSDVFDVWSAQQVPVFHLVRCVIERSRETRTRPRIPGIPELGPRLSRTTSMLMSYGSDARPLIAVEE